MKPQRKDAGGRKNEQHPNHYQPKPSPVQSAEGSVHQVSDSTATNECARTDHQSSQKSLSAWNLASTIITMIVPLIFLMSIWLFSVIISKPLTFSTCPFHTCESQPGLWLVHKTLVRLERVARKFHAAAAWTFIFSVCFIFVITAASLPLHNGTVGEWHLKPCLSSQLSIWPPFKRKLKTYCADWIGIHLIPVLKWM